MKLQEPVHIMLTEVSANWNGVLRFGVTSYDPEDIQIESLPRYVCPDLTNLFVFFRAKSCSL